MIHLAWADRLSHTRLGGGADPEVVCAACFRVALRMHILALGWCASLVGTSYEYLSHFPLPHHLLPLLFLETHLWREMDPSHQGGLLSVRVDGFI